MTQNEPAVQPDVVRQLQPFRETFEAVRVEIQKVFVGADRSVEHLLIAVFSGGHVLLTGVPGLGRTLLVKSLASVLGLTHNRIQFTSDLLPTDITGSEVLERTPDHERRFRFFKGPVFCHLLLADEINRSSARTQAALLEAMHECQVTAAGETHFLPRPFIVVATRNSMETEGVWRMPEAQIDRFMLAIELGYLTEEEEMELIRRTTGAYHVELRTMADPDTILRMQNLAAAIPVAPAVKRYAVDIVRCSRPGAGAPKEVEPLVRLGASPRAAQSILRGAKVMAIVRGRSYVTREDLRAVAVPALDHRLMLDFRAISRGVRPGDVVAKLIAAADRHRVPEGAYRYNRRLVLRPMQQAI